MQTLLLSRKFWAALIGLVLIILTSFFPDLPDLNAPLVELTSLVSAFILGNALEPNQHPTGQAIQNLVHSRKFWATLIGLLLIIIRTIWPALPLSDDQISAMVLTLVAFIVGTGLQDGLQKQGKVQHG